MAIDQVEIMEVGAPEHVGLLLGLPGGTPTVVDICRTALDAGGTPVEVMLMPADPRMPSPF